MGTNQTKSMKCPSINCFVTYSSDTFLLCIFALLLPLLLLLLLLSCTLIPVLISYPSLIMLLFLSFSFSLCLHLYLSFKFSCFFFLPMDYILEPPDPDLFFFFLSPTSFSSVMHIDCSYMTS